MGEPVKPARITSAQLPGTTPLVSTDRFQLMRVSSSAVLDAGTWKWTYQLLPAIAQATSPFGTATRTGVTTTERGLSVSEMGNTATHVCGGIPVAQIPVGFAPVKLHDGCAVWCQGCRDSAGQFYWAILTPTQAISGTC